MLKLIFTLVGIFMHIALSAQSSNQIKTAFGNHGLSCEYSRQLAPRINIICEAGLDWEGKTKRLNDPLTGLGAGFDLYKSSRNRFEINVLTGFQAINHELYHTRLWYTASNLEYTYLFGKNKTQGVVITLGYRYGKGRYKQTNSDEYFTTVFTGVHKLTPFTTSIGYCFRF